ncbi:thioredoxin [Ectothiorhodospira haloalkaliphila]|uniref:Thioredoxin n=1 Tax=Ectothiorhodospira haloalkaliphila TaxID=421628 RepID=W8KS43_9GAMM|nr:MULTISPECIES: thioredoxin domain-containing protein [Ectothiorhodospira]AHK78401.1 thioredoxin [Ectothiorhodospira haloalkaliphila]MCG5495920.1 thiol reductase thioredoxin [Ectothiorhodospira variabilis]MCG5499006.1 thiol reductase thioredoxin [Ectothiorhodospira variabilis]MCG5505381.1 thiol reductase thioredoxin [Ectothiorhodospira variabilis]MCG5508555.1 thiol reductase thioredoxin [Ectothiorhodospira variabilis]
MAVIDITQDRLEAAIRDSGTLILDFWAPWCAPCRAFAPIFEEASEQFPDVVFGKVNTEEEQQLAALFQIRSIPTLMIFREQIIVFNQPGMLSASQLNEVLEKVAALDMDDVRSKMETGPDSGEDQG